MSVSLKFDSQSGDLAFEDGKFQLISTKQDISEHQLTLRLNINRGTWYRNINTFLPLLKNDNNPVQILGAVPKAVFDSYVQEQILACEFITEITEYESELNKETRKITVTAVATTEEGDVSITTDIGL